MPPALPLVSPESPPPIEFPACPAAAQFPLKSNLGPCGKVFAISRKVSIKSRRQSLLQQFFGSSFGIVTSRWSLIRNLADGTLGFILVAGCPVIHCHQPHSGPFAVAAVDLFIIIPTIHHLEYSSGHNDGNTRIDRWLSELALSIELKGYFILIFGG